MEVKNENTLATLNPKSIPATLRIGVTGHRDLTEMETIVLNIRQIINQLDDWFKKKLVHTPYHTYAVVSPLAEGADRLVAKEVLDWNTSSDAGKPWLEAVLPLPEEDYIRDFTQKDSRDKFYELFNRRTSVKIFPPTELREKAYETAGHYVVDNCDVLIAVWDGKEAKGQGGTAEIYKCAKDMGRHIFRINSKNGEVKEIKPKGIGRKYIESLKDLNELNAGKKFQDEPCKGFIKTIDGNPWVLVSVDSTNIGLVCMAGNPLI